MSFKSYLPQRRGDTERMQFKFKLALCVSAPLRFNFVQVQVLDPCAVPAALPVRTWSCSSWSGLPVDLRVETGRANCRRRVFGCVLSSDRVPFPDCRRLHTRRLRLACAWSHSSKTFPSPC